MDKLGKWIADQVLLEGKVKKEGEIKKVIGIYPGRFQPMGEHHAQAYHDLAGLGFDEVWVVTSNKVDLPKSPFNYKEKEKIIKSYGINKVKQVKDPYKALELLKNYPEESTAAVFMLGAKDAGRLGGKHFRKWEGIADVGYKDGAYIYTVKDKALNVPGYGKMDGTTIRKALGQPLPKEDDFEDISDYEKALKIATKEKQKLFKGIFGHTKNYDWIVKKLLKLNEYMESFIIADILGEGSATNFNPNLIDDGPSIFFGNYASYKKQGDDQAEMLGMHVTDYLMKPDQMKPIEKKDTYPAGPVRSVSFFPAGIADKPSAANLEDLRGSKAFNYWKNHIERYMDNLGYEVVSYLGAEKAIEQSKTQPKTRQNFIKEGSSTEPSAKGMVDDGPPTYFMSFKGYESKGNFFAEKLGWEVIDYVLSGAKEEKITGNQTIEPVTYFPAGVQGKKSPMNTKDFKGSRAYKEWVKRIKKVALVVGYKFLNFKGDSAEKEAIKFSKKEPNKPDKNLAKVEKLIDKQRKKETEIEVPDTKVNEQALTKQWWANIMEDITLPISVGDTVYMGKFKNKKVVIKTIDWNEKGDLLINGKSAMRMRIPPKQNVFDEAKKSRLARTTHKFKVQGPPEKIKRVRKGQRVIYTGEQNPDDKFKGKKGTIIRRIDDRHVAVEIDGMKGLYQMHKNDLGIIKEGVTPEQVHQVADKAGIEWDDNKEFMDFCEKVTGKRHIDNMSSESRKKLINAIQEDRLVNEGLILEGGAYGHMSHPFDDKEMTFGDFRNLINMGLQGRLDVKDSATEKTDGQNLMVTWKDGKLKAARNKSTIKNPMDISQMKSKFAGRGNIEKAFIYSMKDLEKAVGSLNDAQKEKIFKGGKAFMNLEIIYPASENIISYDIARIQFHGAIEYDLDTATPVGAVPDSGRMLTGMITQVNQNAQKNFKIIPPQIITMKSHHDFGERKSHYESKLGRLQKKFNLKDTSTLAEYHQAWWEDHVDKKFKGIDNNIKMGLVKRWAFNDKSFRLTGKTISDKDLLEKIKKEDKVKVAAQVKKNMLPFEALIFELGADILKNAENLLAANPDKGIQNIRKKLASSIKTVKKGGDLSKLKTVKDNLAKIQAAGGFEKIVPTEGIVILYNGKTYKITGIFGPVNQIINAIW